MQTYVSMLSNTFTVYLFFERRWTKTSAATAPCTCTIKSTICLKYIRIITFYFQQTLKLLVRPQMFRWSILNDLTVSQRTQVFGFCLVRLYKQADFRFTERLHVVSIHHRGTGTMRGGKEKQGEFCISTTSTMKRVQISVNVPAAVHHLMTF